MFTFFLFIFFAFIFVLFLIAASAPGCVSELASVFCCLAMFGAPAAGRTGQRGAVEKGTGDSIRELRDDRIEK